NPTSTWNRSARQFLVHNSSPVRLLFAQLCKRGLKLGATTLQRDLCRVQLVEFWLIFLEVLALQLLIYPGLENCKLNRNGHESSDEQCKNRADDCSSLVETAHNLAV